MKRIYKSPLFPFLPLFAAALAMHINLPVIYDDALPAGGGLKWAYYNWSSRIIIYAVSGFFVKHKILWVIADSAILTAAAALLSYLFADIKNRRYNLLACALVMVYPFYHMASAGYISTTTNYLWPLAAALAALMPLKKLPAPWLYPLFALAMLYAANLEQTALILFAVYIVFIAKNRAFKSFLSVQAALALAGLVFIFTCPGNFARLAAEAPRMAGFFEISLFAKLKIAFISALGHFLYRPNLTFLLFAALLAFAARRVYAAVPLAVVLVFGFVGAASGLAGLQMPLRNSGGVLALIVLLAAAGCVCIGLFAAFEDRRKAWLCLLALAAGFGGKFITAVSPTVLASSNRTFIFMHFAFLICSLMLFTRLHKKWLYGLLCLCIFGNLAMFYAYNYTKYIELSNSAAYGKTRALIEKIRIN